MAKKFLYTNADGLNQESTGAFEESDHIDASTGAADAGKPIVLDADGKIDESMVDSSDVAHDDTDGAAASTIHAAHPLLDGTRPYTGDQSMGGNKITSLADPTAAQDAVTKAYTDAVATGLRPKGNVAVATTANITLAGLQTIDTYTTLDGDRVLVKDQTDPTENGVYIAGSGAWTRSPDLDNDPLSEIVNGVFIPTVLNGAVNLDTPFFISSVGTGPDGTHIIGTDPIIFEVFTSPTQLQAGDGIDISSNIVAVDLAANSALSFDSAQLKVDESLAGDGLAMAAGVMSVNVDDSTVEVSADVLQVKDLGITAAKLNADTAGEGLTKSGTTGALDVNVDDATIEVDTDILRVKADGINDTHIDFGTGANQVNAEDLPIIDSAGVFIATNTEAALKELYDSIAAAGVTYTVGTGGVSAGDLLYVSGSDVVNAYNDISLSHRGVGVALSTEPASNVVKVLANDTVVPSILGGTGVAGTPYYWDGTSIVNSIPSGSGSHVWQVGIAKNSNDLHVEVRFVKINA